VVEGGKTVSLGPSNGTVILRWLLHGLRIMVIESANDYSFRASNQATKVA
jgi:hypothetical protein